MYKERNVDKESIIGQTERAMMDNGLRMRYQGLGFINGQMGGST
jgi:hypothetical protein